MRSLFASYGSALCKFDEDSPGVGEFSEACGDVFSLPISRFSKSRRTVNCARVTRKYWKNFMESSIGSGNGDILQNPFFSFKY